MSGRGGHRGGIRIFGSRRGRGIRRNFNTSNNINKRHELKIHLHITGLDRHTAPFTKVEEFNS